MTPVTNPGGGTNTNLTNINGSNTTVTITSGSTTGNIIVNGSNNTVNIPSGTWNLAGFTMNGSGNKINITGNVTLIASGDFLMNGNNNIQSSLERT